MAIKDLLDTTRHDALKLPHTCLKSSVAAYYVEPAAISVQFGEAVQLAGAPAAFATVRSGEEAAFNRKMAAMASMVETKVK